MADQWTGGQYGPGERWNVNLPAVVGVVFVFLLGVVIWVIASSGDDEAAGGSTLPSVPQSLVTTTTVTGVGTTSPLPMPVTTPVAGVTLPPTSPATSTTPATAPTVPPPTAPLAPPTEAPDTTPPPNTGAAGSGDLGVPGHPIQRPPCDGGYITVLASAIGDQATPSGMDAVLDQYTGSSYLRTDQTCPSLTQSSGGQPIYVVYLGPYAVDADACQARSIGPNGAYVRRLSNDLTPQHTVDCP
jgi:hypothetical protein